MSNMQGLIQQTDESKNKFLSNIEGETSEQEGKVSQEKARPIISSEKLIEQAGGIKSQRQILPTSNEGLLIGSSLEEQYRIACLYHKSTLMPQALNTPEKILVALQLCHELGLPPMTSVSKIAVINGVASLFGDLPLSLVWKSGHLDSIKEEFIMDGEEVRGAKCTVKRKGQEPATREFLEFDAKKAGLLGKGVWAKYPKRMYQYRARAWALKDIFPDVLNGLSIAEWDFNTDGSERDVSNSKLDELNSLGEQKYS